MKLKRFWANEIDVANYWKEPQYLAKHRSYMCFYDPDYIKTDENGYRIPDGFNSLNDKYHKSKDKIKIFCLGGSTTFGAYCQYQESYPNHLESLNNHDYSVFNIGLPGADMKSSVYTLMYFLRLEIIPNIVIFYDGINEKQAWFQALYGYEKYEELDYQHHSFLRLINKANKYDSIANYINSIRKNKIVQETYTEDFNFLRFVVDQSSSYLKSKNVIEKMSNQWNFKTMFFLQPTVFDFVQDQLNTDTRLRYDYLKALYRSIIKKSKNTVFDISQNIDLEPEMYIDWQHCNEDGNYKIAKKILEYL